MKNDIQSTRSVQVWAFKNLAKKWNYSYPMLIYFALLALKLYVDIWICCVWDSRFSFSFFSRSHSCWLRNEWKIEYRIFHACESRAMVCWLRDFPCNFQLITEYGEQIRKQLSTGIDSWWLRWFSHVNKITFNDSSLFFIMFIDLCCGKHWVI